MNCFRPGAPSCWEIYVGDVNAAGSKPNEENGIKFFGICVTFEYKIYSIPRNAQPSRIFPYASQNQKTSPKSDKNYRFSSETGCLRFVLQHFSPFLFAQPENKKKKVTPGSDLPGPGENMN